MAVVLDMGSNDAPSWAIDGAFQHMANVTVGGNNIEKSQIMPTAWRSIALLCRINEKLNAAKKARIANYQTECTSAAERADEKPNCAFNVASRGVVTWCAVFWLWR